MRHGVFTTLYVRRNGNRTTQGLSLDSLPGIDGKTGAGFLDEGGWWVKFTIDVGPLARRVVRDLVTY